MPVNLLTDVIDIKYEVEKFGARVLFETPFGWVNMRGLSLGYRTMLAWVVDFMASLFNRFPDSADPLAEPAIVLIDELARLSEIDKPEAYQPQAIHK